MNISGSIVALVTPFKNYGIDEKSLQELVEWHVNEGTEGIVVVGSTGEAYLMTQDERIRVIQIATSAANGKIPIIAGCGHISSFETINEAKRIEKETNADALMMVSPAYIKPTEEGIFLHISSLALATKLPIILYNNPGRSAIDIKVETIVKISKEIDSVIGLKDSHPDISRATAIKMMIDNKNFKLLSGEDRTNLGFLAHGGDGFISVTANVFPNLSRKFLDAWRNGNSSEALFLHKKLMHTHNAMFIKSNPIPVKFALSYLKKISNELRMPLTKIEDSLSKEIIIEAISII